MIVVTVKMMIRLEEIWQQLKIFNLQVAFFLAWLQYGPFTTVLQLD